MLRALALSALLAAPAGAQPLRLAVDRAEIVAMPAPPADIILGNPAIASALPVGAAGLVVTGRSPGTTNLIVLGADGAALAHYDIVVTAGDVLTIHRGVARESFVCAPLCESVLRPGDAPERRDALASGMARRLEAARAAQ